MSILAADSHNPLIPPVGEIIVGLDIHGFLGQAPEIELF